MLTSIFLKSHLICCSLHIVTRLGQHLHSLSTISHPGSTITVSWHFKRRWLLMLSKWSTGGKSILRRKKIVMKKREKISFKIYNLLNITVQISYAFFYLILVVVLMIYLFYIWLLHVIYENCFTLTPFSLLLFPIPSLYQITINLRSIFIIIININFLTLKHSIYIV